MSWHGIFHDPAALLQRHLFQGLAPASTKKRGRLEKRRNIPEKERVCKEAKLVILDRTFCEGVTKAKWPKMADFRAEFQRPESLRRPV